MFPSEVIKHNKCHYCTFTQCADPRFSKYYHCSNTYHHDAKRHNYLQGSDDMEFLEIGIELLEPDVIREHIDNLIPLGGFAYVDGFNVYRKGWTLRYFLDEIIFISKYFPDLIDELPIHIIELIPQCCEQNHVKFFQYITDEYYYDFTARGYGLFRKTIKNHSFDVAKLIMKELNFNLPYHLYSDYLELVRYRAGHIIYRNLRSYCGRISLKK